MKTSTGALAMVLLFVCASTVFGQTIRRVNNSGLPLGTNMYPKLQDAHNAASDGDIIYVEGSGTEYDNLVCTKRLTIIGPGYLLGENYTHFSNVAPATLNTVTFDPGSAGSTIIGVSGAEITVKVSNITVSRTLGSHVSMWVPPAALTGILINKNYNLRISANSSYSISSHITNNFITTCSMSNDENSGTFANNIFTGTVSLRNFNVFNNIMITGSVNLANCNTYNNIDAEATANSTAFGTANGNLANVDKTKLFLGLPDSSTDGQWRLKAGSVAIGAGFNGADCGMYGGTDPYEVSGLSKLDYPAITSFTTSGSGSDTTPLSVTISTKSN